MHKRKNNKDYPFKDSNDEYYMNDTHYQGWGQLQDETTTKTEIINVDGSRTINRS